MKDTCAAPGIPALSRNDELICQFAQSLLERLGTEDEHRRKVIDNLRSKIKTVGRLLKTLNEEANHTLSYYIIGSCFNKVVKCVKELTLSIQTLHNLP